MTRFSRRSILGSIGALSASTAVGGPARAQEDETGLHLYNLLIRNRAAFEQSMDFLGQRGGKDLVAPIIFALRFSPNSPFPMNDLLHEITGDTGPDGWHDWMLWQEQHPEYKPHSALIDMKRAVYLSLDPNWDIFLKPEYLQPENMKIRLEEITWGGVRKDGIPSLDNPELVAPDADEAAYLVDDDLVFGVSINGDKRAYPLRIMGWHEMFNDVIGGVPLAMAYCTLCGSGILFETEVEGFEKPLVFGSSGFLYRSNKLMFDRTTHSLWNQFTGKPVSGELVDSGIELKQRPIAIAPWGEWKRQNPDTKVITLDTGHSRDYGSGVVYRDYFASPDLMFPTNTDESRLRQKDYVFGIRTFGASKAWSLRSFEGGKVVNDQIAETPLVLVGNAEGRTVRAYESGGRSFVAGASPRELKAGAETWKITEEALIGPDLQKLPRVPGHIAYWFAWDGYLGAKSDFFDG